MAPAGTALGTTGLPYVHTPIYMAPLCWIVNKTYGTVDNIQMCANVDGILHNCNSGCTKRSRKYSKPS
jgi:hypothetical protein